jgi:hypothetical protein
MQQYTEQSAALDVALRGMEDLEPGNWTEVDPEFLDDPCAACSRCRFFGYVGGDFAPANGVEPTFYTNLELEKELEMDDIGEGGGGVCALCAWVIAKSQAIHRQYTTTTITAASGSSSVSVVVSRKLPDGLKLAPRERMTLWSTEFKSMNRCSQQRSAVCYGMLWSGPLVFWNPEGNDRVCVLCADENDARERQKNWYGAAREALLAVRTPTSKLPVVIVDLIGSYHLGRNFSSVPIFISRSPDGSESESE